MLELRSGRSSLEFNNLDLSKEVEIEITDTDGVSNHFWIDQDEAQLIINHLTKQFKIV